MNDFVEVTFFTMYKESNSIYAIKIYIKISETHVTRLKMIIMYILEQTTSQQSYPQLPRDPICRPRCNEQVFANKGLL